MRFFVLASLISSSGRGFFPIAVLVAFDAVIPMTPGEAAVIAGGILAEQGKQSLLVVLFAAIAGAVIGDNVAYQLGRRFGEPLARRIAARGDEGGDRLARAERQSEDRPWIVAAARFIPGGRTVATVAAGVVKMPWRMFAAYQLAGATTWAILVTALGYLGGSIFEDSFWKPFLVSLAFALLISAIAEGYRRRLQAQDRLP